MCKNGAHYEVRTRPAYAHFSILGAQERNCRLDEGSGTSREIGGTLGKGTELKERASKSKGDARA